MKITEFSSALITGATSDLAKALIKRLPMPLILTAPSGPVKADLTKKEDRQKICALIEEKCPDLIINNAGKGLYGPILSHSINEELSILKLNAEAALEICYTAAKTLKKRKKRGVILNIGSAAGLFSYPNFATYSASKAFLLNFSKAFDRELKPFGVRVLCACPGQIATSFRKKASKGFFDQASPFTMSVDTAVKHLIKQIESEKCVSIFDYRTKLGTFMFRLFPSYSVLMRAIHNRFDHNGL